ncbi:MAG: LLM class oxidoreductase [Bacteroidota bacterium]
MHEFEPINRAYNQVFKSGKLSLGIVVPIENYAQSSVPSMAHHLERVELIERLGFSALWVRDVPFHVPSFGDAGQTYDPFTYLGYLAGRTKNIGLGIGSIALPLHHPVHVVKSAATIDQLSGGRLLMGVASGDRPTEYPAMGIEFDQRGELFREAFQYIRSSQENFPSIESKHFGKLDGQVDILPKAKGPKIPLLITGHSRQSLEWNAQEGDGWMSYPKNLSQQAQTIAQWRELVEENSPYSKPFLQPLYVDLVKDENALPQGIHLGFRLGLNYLIEYLKHLEHIGVNHVMLNLRFNQRDIETSLEELAEKVLPHFTHSQKKEKLS